MQPKPFRHLAASFGAFLATIALTAASSAQSLRFREETATRLPTGLAGPCMDAAAGDADGDGDIDLVLAMEFQPNALLLNDGTGRFALAADRFPRSIHDSEDVAFADFDRDGDLDLLFVSEDDRQDELYINDGDGRFSDASARLPTDAVSNALAVIDLDGDGAPDILTGNIGTNRVLLNDGRGQFRDATSNLWPQTGTSNTQDLELADLDNDGDLDVIVGNEGQNQLFINRDGRLVDATNDSLPVRHDETREIRAGDIDNDGDLDLVVANVRFAMDSSAQDFLLLNDGDGRFTTAEIARFPEDARDNFTVQLVDLDRDGDLDVLAPSTVFPRRETEFLVVVLDADGRSAVIRAPQFDLDDVDDDGDSDVVVSDGDERRVFVNDGGKLTAAQDEAEWVATTGLEDMDTNDDGHADIATAAFAFAGAADGAGATTTIQVVDLDRDGDIEVFLVATTATEASGNYLVMLNGGGRFTLAEAGSALPIESDGNGFDIEVVDIDADGIDDLFFCNRASIAEPASAAVTGGLQRLLIGTR